MVTTTTEVTVENAEAALVDTGRKYDALGRRLITVEERAALVVAFRQSGLTQAEFARREGVVYSTFASWVQGRRAKPIPAKPTRPMKFAEVRLPATTGLGLEVRCPDGTVLRGTNAADLAALVRALRS